MVISPHQLLFGRCHKNLDNTLKSVVEFTWWCSIHDEEIFVNRARVEFDRIFWSSVYFVFSHLHMYTVIKLSTSTRLQNIMRYSLYSTGRIGQNGKKLKTYVAQQKRKERIHTRWNGVGKRQKHENKLMAKRGNRKGIITLGKFQLIRIKYDFFSLATTNILEINLSVFYIRIF